MKKISIIIAGFAIASSAVALGFSLHNPVYFNNHSSKTVYEMNTDIDTTTQINSSIFTPNDYTVDIEEYNFTEEEKSKAQKVGYAASFSTSFKELKNLCTNEASIECKVLKVANTLKDGIPYTKYDVEVTDVLFGNLNVGDKVTVMQMGGYMTLQDEVEAFNNATKFKDVPEESWKDIIIEKQGERMECPSIGERYILFMSKDTAVFKDIYFPVNFYEGIYKYNSETGRYVRNMPEEIFSDIDDISLDDLKIKCAEYIK